MPQTKEGGILLLTTTYSLYLSIYLYLSDRGLSYSLSFFVLIGFKLDFERGDDMRVANSHKLSDFDRKLLAAHTEDELARTFADESVSHCSVAEVLTAVRVRDFVSKYVVCSAVLFFSNDPQAHRFRRTGECKYYARLTIDGVPYCLMHAQLIAATGDDVREITEKKYVDGVYERKTPHVQAKGAYRRLSRRIG